MKKTENAMETTIKKYGLIPLSTKNRLLITDVICYLFVLLFVYTAAGKLITIETFKDVLTKYPLLSGYSTIIAYLIPVSELLVATLLIIPATKKYGIIASLGLMTLFITYIIYMFVTKSSLPCSCGGIISKLSWQQHIWFNSIFVLLALLALKIYKK
ncbi:MAG: MauE/DoxX family redox-associated membrane protein [Bacteroidota bacterium]